MKSQVKVSKLFRVTLLFLSHADFLQIQLFLNDHNQYIKINALESKVKEVAGKTVNPLMEQMDLSSRALLSWECGKDINSLEVSVSGNCSAFIMPALCIIHECHKTLKNWHFMVRMIKQPLYLSFTLVWYF